MNLGLRDAVTLGDALSVALTEGRDDKLDEYAADSRAEAMRVVALAHRLTRLATCPAGGSPAAQSGATRPLSCPASAAAWPSNCPPSATAEADGGTATQPCRDGGAIDGTPRRCDRVPWSVWKNRRKPPVAQQHGRHRHRP